jgi:hypothetical protein
MSHAHAPPRHATRHSNIAFSIFRVEHVTATVYVVHVILLYIRIRVNDDEYTMRIVRVRSGVRLAHGAHAARRGRAAARRRAHVRPDRLPLRAARRQGARRRSARARRLPARDARVPAPCRLLMLLLCPLFNLPPPPIPHPYPHRECSPVVSHKCCTCSSPQYKISSAPRALMMRLEIGFCCALCSHSHDQSLSCMLPVLSYLHFFICFCQTIIHFMK